ncbi:YadA-like family protein [Veillonella magna]|uniref:YadA-like family protein n=1 Tax=Veillonella magna TaxID=464322 RepID=UPI0019606804|nr:YadA-like family protein [Veillonella magna]
MVLAVAAGFVFAGHGVDVMAEGYNAGGGVASGNFSVAIGQGSKTDANYTTAIGGGSQSLKQGAIAIGQATVAKEGYTIAVGYGAQANESHAMGFGYGARANAKNSIAFGGTNDVENTASFNNRKITNVSNGNIAQNSKEVVNGGQLYTVQEDLKKKVDSGTVEGAGSLAVGKTAEAKGYIATAVGYGHALDTYTVAMGVNAYAYNANGIAIGTLAKAGATNEDYANADIFDRIDPETGKPLYNISPGGDPRTIRSGAIAIGNGAEAVGYRNTVIGEAAKAGIIIDRDAHNHPNKFGLGAVGATAIGAAAMAGGSQATVVGNGAVAEGKFSVGMGTRSYTTGKADTAVGTYSVVTEDSAVALGAYARADHKNSVALGNSSITEEAKATQSITLNGKVYTFAGGNQSQVVGTVSIGGQGVLGYTDTTDKGHWNDPPNATNGNGRTDMNTSIYRTITNVAAGRINAESTDAINGSQLYAVMGATEENRKLIEDNAINLAQTDYRINRRIDSVEEESRTGDAMNAALAALKPIQFDPDEPSQIMAGVGGYKGKHAYALGVAHYFNESVMANIGGSYSSGSSLMWNAGVTFKVGTGSDKTYEPRRGNYKEALAKSQEEIAQLRTELQETKDEVATLKAALADIQKKLK